MRQRFGHGHFERRWIYGLDGLGVTMTSLIARSILFMCLLSIACPALAQTEQKRYEVYPPTLFAPDTVELNVHNHIHSFVAYQMMGAGGGALLARVFVDSSATTMLSWGIAGGLIVSGIFIVREFEVH